MTNEAIAEQLARADEHLNRAELALRSAEIAYYRAKQPHDWDHPDAVVARSALRTARAARDEAEAQLAALEDAAR